ncbi:MAG: membrane dipeptidase [Myxococcota bacterium]
MLTGRSVYLNFLWSFGLVAGCGDDIPSAADDGTAGLASSTGVAGSDGSADTEAGSSETGEEPPAPRLRGIADLHLHMFAAEAFGGGWFHGTHQGPGDVALAPCDGGEPGDHGRLKQDLAPLLGTCEGTTLEDLAMQVPLVGTIAFGGGGLVTEFISVIPGSNGDTGEHPDRTGGWPELDGWPRWDALAHQQVWEEHLKTAYDDGLRVEVISAVSLDWLCRALPDENVERPQCNEMDDVRLQLQMANEFADANDWVEVALSAEDVRRIVEEDKLAFILSVEASHIMADGDWRPQLMELYDLGVRTLQPVHQLDNRFGGAAPHNTIFQIARYAENCHIDTDCGLTSPTVTLGVDVDENCKNVLGLTDEGRELVQAMIDLEMIVDGAHLSEASVRDLYEILVDNDYYPFYLSHGHFREIMANGKNEEEKTSPAWVIEMVRATGGMFGLRTAHEEVNTYEDSPVENTCHGSSRSFSQAYDYGRLGLKVAMGLGSDLNGFIQQTRPRFGPDACSASFDVEADCQARDELSSGVPPLGTGFDEAGLGHMGLLGDLLDDLDQLGSDTEPLRTSADDFVRMWERAAGTREGPAEDVSDRDTEGIVVAPAHGFRRAEFPQECNEPYCPDAFDSGAQCRFDAECINGACLDAGECGFPAGTCE